MSLVAKKSTFKRFLRFAKPYWLSITGAILCGELKFTLALALPVSLKYVTDYIFMADVPGETKLWRLAGALGMLTLVFLVRTPVTYLRSYLSARAGHRTIFDIRKELFHHIQRLSLSYHANQRTGATISRLINDLNIATGILNQGIISLAMDVIFLIGVVTFLLIYDFELALVSLFVLPFYAVVFRLVQPRLRSVATEVQEEMEEMSGEVTEKVGGVQVVQSFVREKTEERNFFTRHKRYYFKVLQRVRLRLVLTCAAEFLTAVGPMVVIGYGGYRVIQGSLSLGDLLLFQGSLQHLYLPCRRLADYSALLSEKLGAMDRVFDVF
ncbi:MAG: ABC transporter ATP-binding protein, partial [Candidatus Hydrogenedentota bacterium]